MQIVLFLPALCRKMGVPYCIVKGKARLGRLVRRKNCSVVALTQVCKVVFNSCIIVIYILFNCIILWWVPLEPIQWHIVISKHFWYTFTKVWFFYFYFSFIKIYCYFRWILAIEPTSQRLLKPLKRTSMIDTMKSGVIGVVVYWEANPRPG